MKIKNLLCRNKFLSLEELLQASLQDSSQKINLCSSSVLNKAAFVAVPVEKIPLIFESNLLCRKKFLLWEDLLRARFQESSEKINLDSFFRLNKAASMAVPVEKILNNFSSNFCLNFEP